MKKLLIAALLLSAVGVAKADTTNATIYVNLGALKLYLPVASGLDTSYLWDLNNKRSLVGGETPVATYKNFTLVAGGVTSLDGQGAPFARVYYSLSNPVSNFWEALNKVNLGAFAGKDFSIGGKASYIYGLGASYKLW